MSTNTWTHETCPCIIAYEFLWGVLIIHNDSEDNALQKCTLIGWMNECMSVAGAKNKADDMYKNENKNKKQQKTTKSSTKWAQ